MMMARWIMDGWMDEWVMDGWMMMMAGWIMDGWMDEWVSVCVFVCAGTSAGQVRWVGRKQHPSSWPARSLMTPFSSIPALAQIYLLPRLWFPRSGARWRKTMSPRTPR